MTVETGGVGGFLPDDRPRILFESARFHALTDGKYDRAHPTISTKSENPKLYRGGAAEYLRLNEAVALDRHAALCSASWGLFQILGENAAMCGFADVEPYVTAMAASARAQLEAFSAFVKADKLLDALKACDWAGFAARYNGPAYRSNAYDTKLAAAYARAGGTEPVTLCIGARGPAVVQLQNALGITPADGVFGRMTEAALIAAQTDAGLTADGIVGPETAAVLNLPQA